MTRPAKQAAAPSEETLAQVEAELRGLPRGASRAVGGGVQMRLNADGTRAFVVRPRSRGKQAGKTFQSWQQAYDGLQQQAPVAPPPAFQATALSVFDMSPGPKPVIGGR